MYAYIYITKYCAFRWEDNFVITLKVNCVY
jgi:hypothetical protein